MLPLNEKLRESFDSIFIKPISVHHQKHPILQFQRLYSNCTLRADPYHPFELPTKSLICLFEGIVPCFHTPNTCKRLAALATAEVWEAGWASGIGNTPSYAVRITGALHEGPCGVERKDGLFNVTGYGPQNSHPLIASSHVSLNLKDPRRVRVDPLLFAVSTHWLWLLLRWTGDAPVISAHAQHPKSCSPPPILLLALGCADAAAPPKLPPNHFHWSTAN